MSSERPHSYKSILLHQAEQVIDTVKSYDKEIKDRVTRVVMEVHDRVNKMATPFWELLELFSEIEIFDLMDNIDILITSPMSANECRHVEELSKEITDWIDAYISGLIAICNELEPQNIKESKP